MDEPVQLGVNKESGSDKEHDEKNQPEYDKFNAQANFEKAFHSHLRQNPGSLALPNKSLVHLPATVDIYMLPE